ncbi:hypothetical protein OROGR_021171 [Orobanche gracilis]
MRFFSVILLGVALLVGGLKPCQGNTQGYVEPESCRRYECPEYEVVESQKEYQIRSYKLANWIAAAPIRSTSFVGATIEGMRTLTAYIHGKNDQKVELNMTAPVLVDVVPAETGKTASYTAHFYLPKKYQSDPPKSQEVHPVKLPIRLYAAVRRFGGFATDNDVSEQLATLANSVEGSGAWRLPIGFNILPYGVAVYNAPFEHTNHVNEVIIWLGNES